MVSNTFSILVTFLLKRKAEVIRVIFFSIFVYSLVSIPPIFLGKLVDEAIKNKELKISLFFLIIGIAVLALIIERIFWYYLTRFSSKLIHNQYMASVEDILKKERQLFQKTKIGEIIDLFSRYINEYEKIFTSFISSFIPSILAILIILAAVFYISNGTIFFVTLLVQLCIFLVSFYFFKLYSEALKKHTKSCYELSDEWVELLGNNKIIQNEFSFSMALQRLEKVVGTMAANFVKRSRSQSLVASFINFGQSLSVLIIIWALLFFLKNESVTLGSILTVVALNGILGSHFRIVSEFLLSSKNFSCYHQDYQKIFQAKTYLNTRHNKIEDFKKITIKPSDIIKSGKKILHLEKEFNIYKGEKICVLGLSGAGKSTFLSYFFNSNLEYQNLVFVNDCPVSDINSEDYQKCVRICFQENELLSGQGYNSWFQREVDSKKAENLLRQLHFPDDIVSGERYIEPWSGNISGGEAKRLNVIRLLLQPGEVNILDEPTTGLNVSLSKKTWDVIFDVLANKTLICATHDLNYVHNFHKVIIVDEGKIVADVLPSELEGNSFFIKIKDKL